MDPYKLKIKHFIGGFIFLFLLKCFGMKYKVHKVYVYKLFRLKPRKKGADSSK